MRKKREGQVIRPGATIGILGGGQLGRMMATRGREMGYRFICLDPGPDSSCGQVCDRQIVAAYDDEAAARELAQAADVITYEFENVSPEVTALLEEEGYLPQGSDLLRITRHRHREKQALKSAGAEVAPYAYVVDEGSFEKALEKIGVPSVLKSATGGYDGKRQQVIRTLGSAPQAFQELAGTGELVLEQFIAFEKELSVVVARSTTGEVRAFPVAENIHVDNILHLSIAPARVSEEVAKKASEMALQIACTMDVVGTLGIEFFLTTEGRLLVNEVAPRPHNSGHFTMDACLTSQFEQHLRAICGLPLGCPSLQKPVVMVNLLGQHVEAWLSKVADPAPKHLEIKTHIYGKSPARSGRKMGHLNLLVGGGSTGVEEGLDWVKDSLIWRQ